MDRRRDRRWKVTLKTTVNLDGYSRPCQLVNVSARGALIAASFHPRLGTEVELDIPGMGWTSASVVRVTSAYIALSFDQPIDVAEVVDADVHSLEPALVNAVSAAV